nr:MAG TPA: ERF superfamily protein [Caudoviricetes sp.]
MNIQEKLKMIQCELKAPKSQHNNFGNYNYRSLEDINESVKPILDKVGATIVLSDDIVFMGERYYVKATATLYDTESNESISVTALARETDVKKGMDSSQVTGATSSYARKYALNGLFAIDDTKDADSEEYKTEDDKRGNAKATIQSITKAQVKEIRDLAEVKRIKISDLEDKKNKKIEEFTPAEYAKTMSWLKGL